MVNRLSPQVAEDRKTPFPGSGFSEVVLFYDRAGSLHEPGVLADVAFVGAGERVAHENLVLRLRGVAGGDCRGAIADVGEGDNVREWMGIEPTRRRANRRLNGFEGRGTHQASGHSQNSTQ